nr:serine/threonine-protein kinase [Gemmatimonadaceae bacterium]
LPPGWSWGDDGVVGEHRHFQEVVDALGRSLSLVSAPDPAHADWLRHEARALAHRNHPAIPTTYHYWANFRESRRGPGYLRRWIVGETVASRLSRVGTEPVLFALQLLRQAGAVLAYLHAAGTVHGALGGDTVWLAPGGRLWLLGWQWALDHHDVPEGLAPLPSRTAWAPEWCGASSTPRDGTWHPTRASDQWQLGALCFGALTGEWPLSHDIPPVALVRPDTPQSFADAVDRALDPDPAARFESVASMLRAVDRGVSPRLFIADVPAALSGAETAEERLKWATGDDYEILTPLGSGTFGQVWRARDLALAREVAIKVLHPHVARDDAAVARFLREARLAAQLVHPAIVPIFDTDRRGDIVWYTMELAEGGSVADLVARKGPRPFEEIAPKVDALLDALRTAHASGIIHRDLKPENILIDRYGRWRIGDFGIAFAQDDGRPGSSGTPAFAAPEQLLGEAQGAATDGFSIAAVVYFVLTGRPPFGDDGGPVVLARQLREPLDVQGMPEPLAQWLRAGLAPVAADRFADTQTMRDAWRDVRSALSRGGDPATAWWRRLVGLAAE